MPQNDVTTVKISNTLTIMSGYNSNTNENMTMTTESISRIMRSALPIFRSNMTRYPPL